MGKKQQPKRHLADATEREVYEAIRYLELDPTCREPEEDDRLVIWISVLILLLGGLGFVWLYRL